MPQEHASELILDHPGTDPFARSRLAGRVLALVLAFFAACPVLMNLAGTYIADGNSFVFTVAVSCFLLLVIAGAGVCIGLPWRAMGALHGGLLIFAVIAGVFWALLQALNVLSPSPQEQMRYQTVESLMWIGLPLAAFIAYWPYIDTRVVVRGMVLCCAVFVVGLSLRWALGLGIYQSGRWHAGESLEAIRTGRYAGLSLWIFALACLCPAAVVPPWMKLVAMLCMPLAGGMILAANSRGPWLALGVTILATAIPLTRLIVDRIGRDVRFLVMTVVVAVAVGAFLVWLLGSAESDFNRLFTLRDDGGSAAERVELWQDHIHMLTQIPLGVISGFGYAHGLYYPHNAFMEALIDGGVVCCGLLLAMTLLTIWTWIRQCPPGDVPGLMFFGIFLSSLVGNQVSGSVAADMSWYGAFLIFLRISEFERGLATSGEVPSCRASR